MADLTRYAYDSRTKVFVGITEAHLDPLNTSRLLEPAFTTTVAPPAIPAGQAAIWGGAAWTLEQDDRGQIWFKGTNPVLVDFLGDPTAQGLTKAPVLPAAPAPTSCSKLGLVRALKARNLWPTVRALIASNADMQEEWDLAVSVEKTDPLIQEALAGLAQAGIAMSDADVNQLIVDAIAAVAPAAA